MCTISSLQCFSRESLADIALDTNNRERRIFLEWI